MNINNYLRSHAVRCTVPSSTIAIYLMAAGYAAEAPQVEPHRHGLLETAGKGKYNWGLWDTSSDDRGMYCQFGLWNVWSLWYQKCNLNMNSVQYCLSGHGRTSLLSHVQCTNVDILMWYFSDALLCYRPVSGAKLLSRRSGYRSGLKV